MAVTEWVLPGETVDNWTELVTVQSVLGAQTKMTAKEFAGVMRQGVLKACRKATWTFLNEGADDAMYEWQTKGCRGWDDQYEVVKVIRGKTAIYRIAYTNRKLPISEEIRRQWTDLTGKASLQAGAAQPAAQAQNQPQAPSKPEPAAAQSATTTLPPQDAAAAAPVLVPSPLGPEGYLIFEGRKDQFTIAIPGDWAVYDQARVLEEHGAQRMANNLLNMIIFYRSPDGPAKGDMSGELLTKIEKGETPSFFVQKVKPGKGMSCGEFPEKAQKEVLKLVSSSDTFANGAKVVETPHAEPMTVAGCKGTKIQGSGQAKDSSTATRHVVYAASDGTVLYLFSLRSPVDKFEQSAGVFEKAVATAKLAAGN